MVSLIESHFTNPLKESPLRARSKSIVIDMLANAEHLMLISIMPTDPLDKFHKLPSFPLK